MAKFYTYIIKSLIKKRFYVGQTSDLEERLNRHNNGMVQSTKSGKPWQLVYFSEFSSRIEAVNLEKKIKGRGAKRYLIENPNDYRESGGARSPR